MLCKYASENRKTRIVRKKAVKSLARLCKGRYIRCRLTVLLVMIPSMNLLVFTYRVMVEGRVRRDVSKNGRQEAAVGVVSSTG